MLHSAYLHILSVGPFSLHTEQSFIGKFPQTWCGAETSWNRIPASRERWQTHHSWSLVCSLVSKKPNDEKKRFTFRRWHCIHPSQCSHCTLGSSVQQWQVSGILKKPNFSQKEPSSNSVEKWRQIYHILSKGSVCSEHFWNLGWGKSQLATLALSSFAKSTQIYKYFHNILHGQLSWVSYRSESWRPSEDLGESRRDFSMPNPNWLITYLYKAKSPYVHLCVSESACQAMAAPTAAPIVTKVGLQTLNITSLKLIPQHLTFEAVLRPKSRSKVPFTTLHRPEMAMQW